MDSQSAIALDGGVEMAVSVPRHCHGPTVVAGAVDKTFESSFPVCPSLSATGSKIVDAALLPNCNTLKSFAESLGAFHISARLIMEK